MIFYDAIPRLWVRFPVSSKGGLCLQLQGLKSHEK